MLYIITPKGVDAFSPRAELKRTQACECPCCTVACTRCDDESACPHSLHGKDGFCVQYAEPGSLLYQLKAARAQDVLTIEPPIFIAKAQEGSKAVSMYRIREKDIPDDFDLSDWAVIDGDYRCLKYYSKPPKQVQECLCETEEDCSHRPPPLEKETTQQTSRPADLIKQHRIRQLNGT